MNNYFNSLTSTSNIPHSVGTSNHESLAPLPYDTDYNRAHFSSNFDRLSSKDPRMGNYSNMNMMGTSSMPTTAHSCSIPGDQNQNTPDYSLAFSHAPSASSMNDLRSQQLPNFSMAVANPMLYYAHPWMRPGLILILYQVQPLIFSL